MHAAVEDAGRYTCIVSNVAGEERKNFDLDVLGNATFFLTCAKICAYYQLSAFERIFADTNLLPSNSAVPPSIEQEGTLADSKVKEQHNITLTCEVSGKSRRD